MTKSLLKKLISIDSRYPGERRLSELLENKLRNIGFKTKRVYVGTGRFNVLATRGVSKKHIMFYGHADTVHLSNAWRTNPFKATEIGGRICGLGAFDMKGGISAFLEALEKTEKPAKVVFCVDEENVSEGAWILVKKHRRFFRDVSIIISAEPNFTNDINAVTNQRTGRYVFEGIITGTAGHIANYKKEDDAVRKTHSLMTLLYSLQDGYFRKRGTLIQIRKVNSESNGMSVPDKSVIEIEALASHLDKPVDILKKFPKQKGVEIKLKDRKTPYLDGYVFNNFEQMASLKKAIKLFTGKRLKLVSRVSVGDDNVFASLGIPVITLGPRGGNAHAPNEFVLKEDLEVMTKIYKDLLENRK